MDIGRNKGVFSETSAIPPRHRTTELLKTIVLFFVFFFAIKTYVIEGYEVQGASMEPTLQNRDRILVLKLPQTLQSLPYIGHFFSTLDPGDIVVFQSHDEPGQSYVKRLIALNRDHTPASVVSASVQPAHTHPGKGALKVTFAGGDIYLDNQKLDQSYLPPGAQTRHHRRTTAQLQPGQLYVMGDHRSLSRDSRNFGPIHQQQVTGTALLRIWPLQRFGWL